MGSCDGTLCPLYVPNKSIRRNPDPFLQVCLSDSIVLSSLFFDIDGYDVCISLLLVRFSKCQWMWRMHLCISLHSVRCPFVSRLLNKPDEFFFPIRQMSLDERFDQASCHSRKIEVVLLIRSITFLKKRKMPLQRNNHSLAYLAHQARSCLRGWLPREKSAPVVVWRMTRQALARIATDL